MWWNDYWPVHWMFFAPVMMMMIFLLLFIAVIYLLMRGGRAMNILKERYARGEISRAEFEELRRLLEA